MLLSLLVLAACYNNAEPESFDPTDPQDTGETLDTGEALDRAYALQEVLSILMDNPNPLDPTSAASVLTTWKLARWHQEGTAVEWEETTCGMESTEVFDTQTLYPAAFVESLSVQTRQGTLSANQVGATFTAGPYATLVGVELGSPLTDAIPTSPDDPAVVDQDQDGFPGVTVHVVQDLLGEGDVYVAQRTITSLEGTVASTSRVEGLLDATSEQSILDASAWWLSLPTNSRPDDDPSHSWFVFQEVDSGATCVDVMDQRATLFQ